MTDSAPRIPHQRGHSRYQRWLESRLPTIVVLMVIGIFYQLVSERRTLGPPWALLVIVAALLLAMVLAEFRGHRLVARILSVAVTSAVTLAVTFSAIILVVQALESHRDAFTLLQDAVVLWLANILGFGLWYWELDGGGPDHRLPHHYNSRDFIFPQRSLDDDASRVWIPNLVDYLFLSFCISMAFSPTDTSVLSRRAKLLVMAQTLISLLCVVVLAARAINTL